MSSPESRQVPRNELAAFCQMVQAVSGGQERTAWRNAIAFLRNAGNIWRSRRGTGTGIRIGNAL